MKLKWKCKCGGIIVGEHDEKLFSCPKCKGAFAPLPEIQCIQAGVSDIEDHAPHLYYPERWYTHADL